MIGGLGLEAPIVESLVLRQVHCARFRVGESWLVLLQPDGNEGAAAEFLAARGEGVFLLSFGVDDLGGATAYAQENGLDARGNTRSGLANWQVQDLAGESLGLGGVTLQICAGD